ncbi:MAG: metal-dependent transcriptional regulator [Clostridia bacterium]|nr:metal-dependent transcriptional regulator [Clostridia bacterium]
MAGNGSITFAMEDYLEMIYRLSDGSGCAVRTKQLADRLNVTPSAVSKMADNLRSLELINYERYGYMTLTDKGRLLGQSLIARHSIINRFLCFINGTESELEETEKIEHYLSPRTISNMQKFLDNI